LHGPRRKSISTPPLSPLLTRPQEPKDLDLVFHANAHSSKASDLAAHADVNLGFLTSAGEWASVSGPARVVTDREEIRSYYSPLLKAWLGDLKDGKHDGGPEDPRICLIKVRAVAAQYAVSRKGLFGTTIELARGVKDGEVPSVNKLRILSQEDIENCECVD
jgi:general stress protein 26